MVQTAAEALKITKIVSDGEHYALIKLPPAALIAAAGVIAEIGEPFASVMLDRYEVSLIIPSDAFGEFAKRLPGAEKSPRDYRLITFDGDLSPDLVGFMARIAAALAEAGVWILPLGAYTRDHLLVPADQFDAAMTALDKLKRSAG
ncbi:MAG: ACT domain-containing protein [Anaerolineae bacterium]